MYSSWKGYAEIVYLLIEKGADVDIQVNDGFTSLMIASEHGQKEIILLLIEAGADIDASTNQEVTPLMIALANGHNEIAELLIEHGADINAESLVGWTALVYASQLGHTEIVRFLIENSVDVDTKTTDGYTALMLASVMEHPENVRLLIEGGADIHIESNDGATALGYAVGRENMQIIRLLNEAAVQLQKDKKQPEEKLYSEITGNITLFPGPHSDMLPEGLSVFFGEYSCAQGVAGTITVMHRSGGDLTSVKLNGSPLSEDNPQPVGHQRKVGTYNPQSNRYTTVPDVWLSPPTPGWIMGGGVGVYDGKTGQLTGTSLIGATWADGSPVCKTYRQSRISPTKYTDIPGEEPFRLPPTLTGIPISLPSGVTHWTGEFACLGTTFTLTLELHHGEGGLLSGKFSYRESDTESSEATFLIRGTHNPDTGRLSMGPDGWGNSIPADGWRQMYFIDGHHLSSPFRLSVRIITGNGTCTDGEIVVLRPVQ